MTEPSPRYIWYVIGLLSVANAFSYMDRMALSMLAPFIKADLHLSDSQLGLLTGVAFSLFYAVCGIPIARWADRGVRRDIIALALAVWSVATALSGVARGFWSLFAARVGIGAGESGCLPPAQSLICDYVPLERRSGAFAVHTFGSYAGMMLGMLLAGWLGEAIGWRMTFVALGIPGIALALVVRLTLREPVRGVLEPGKSNRRPPLGKTIAWLWQCRTYRLLMFVYVLYGFVLYGMSQWWPSFYARIFEFGLATLGLYLGLAIGIGSSLGLLLGGFLANRTARRDVRMPLHIGAAAILLTVPVALLSLFVPSARVSLFLVALITLLLAVSNGPLVANINSVVAPGMRATAGSITIFCASALGFSLGPFGIGWLSDALAPMLGSQSLRYALVAPVCLMPLMALVLYLAARALPQDLESTQESR